MIYYPKQGESTLSAEELNALDERIAELTENITNEKMQNKQYLTGNFLLIN